MTFAETGGFIRDHVIALVTGALGIAFAEMVPTKTSLEDVRPAAILGAYSYVVHRTETFRVGFLLVAIFGAYSFVVRLTETFCVGVFLGCSQVLGVSPFAPSSAA
jgi:hypothetical protein